MVTRAEAARLQRDLRSELNASAGAVWKCAAGLMTIALVALVGIESGIERSDAVHLAGWQAHSVMHAAHAPEGETPPYLY